MAQPIPAEPTISVIKPHYETILDREWDAIKYNFTTEFQRSVERQIFQNWLRSQNPLWQYIGSQFDAAISLETVDQKRERYRREAREELRAIIQRLTPVRSRSVDVPVHINDLLVAAKRADRCGHSTEAKSYARAAMIQSCGYENAYRYLQPRVISTAELRRRKAQWEAESIRSLEPVFSRFSGAGRIVVAGYIGYGSGVLILVPITAPVGAIGLATAADQGYTGYREIRTGRLHGLIGQQLIREEFGNGPVSQVAQLGYDVLPAFAFSNPTVTARYLGAGRSATYWRASETFAGGSSAAFSSFDTIPEGQRLILRPVQINRLELPVLNREFVPSGERVLQNLTNRLNQRLGSNLPLAERVLSPAEIAAAAESSWLARMQYGNALERLVAREIQRDANLSRLFQHVGGPSNPDFIGRGLLQGQCFDITTPGQVRAHFARPGYGARLRVITYQRPPGFP